MIGPQIEQVMHGEGATWHENQLVPIIRHGELQDVYWTYGYSPIDEPAFPHGVGGVLVICSETTEHVLTKQRLSSERERFVQLFDQAPTFLALLRGPDHVIELANPAYLRLIGHRSVVGLTVADALPDAVAQGYLTILDEVYRTGNRSRQTELSTPRPDPSSSEIPTSPPHPPIRSSGPLQASQTSTHCRNKS